MTVQRTFYQCRDCTHEWSHLPMSVSPHCPNCQSVNTEYNKYDLRHLDPECYPFVKIGQPDDQGKHIPATHEQRTALFRKWLQDSNDMTWKDFAATVQQTFHMDDAIVVKWCGMFLAIETTGHCHS